MTTVASPRFYRVKNVAVGTRGASLGTEFTPKRATCVGDVGLYNCTWPDGDISLRFANDSMMFFDPSWLTPVVRDDEVRDVRRFFMQLDDPTPLLRTGTFVRIKCLYTDEQRRAACVGSMSLDWIGSMDAAMGQLGVVTAISTACNYYTIRYLKKHTSECDVFSFNSGWFTVVHDVALEVSRDTAAKLGCPLPEIPGGGDKAAAERKRKRVSEAVDALERDTRDKIATLRASLET